MSENSEVKGKVNYNDWDNTISNFTNIFLKADNKIQTEYGTSYWRADNYKKYFQKCL